MKYCTKCKQPKDIKEFYRDKRNPDGRRSQCKSCVAEYQRSPAGKAADKKYQQTEKGKVMSRRGSNRFRNLNPDYQRGYSQTPAGKAADKKYRENNPEKQREYRQTEKGREMQQNNAVKMRKKFPEKWKSRKTLNNAVQTGKILKPWICSSCNEPMEPKNLHGHHEDYSKPLEVDWLCQQCHKDLHRNEVTV